MEQIRQLIDEAELRDPVLSYGIMLGALTGLRRGELVALQWSSLHVDRLWIEHAIQRINGSLHIGPLKGHNPHWLSIDDVILLTLNLIRDQREKWAADGGTTLTEDCYIITWDSSGVTPGDPHAFTDKFCRLRDRLGIQVRLHDIRHAVAYYQFQFPVGSRRGAGGRDRRSPPVGHHPPLQLAFPGRQGRRARSGWRSTSGPGRDLTPTP
jgi:integrase